MLHLFPLESAGILLSPSITTREDDGIEGVAMEWGMMLNNVLIAILLMDFVTFKFVLTSTTSASDIKGAWASGRLQVPRNR